MATAKQIAARKLFAERAKAGEFAKRKSNPLTRVKVKSPSYRTGKAPSKRLITRRKSTKDAPAGYYANPLKSFIVKLNTENGRSGKWTRKNSADFGEDNQGVLIDAVSAESAVEKFNSERAIGNQYNPFYLKVVEIKVVESERKQNPLTRVKVKSPSYRTGNAPSKRLVQRRKATKTAPAGYYANPVTKSKKSTTLPSHVMTALNQYSDAGHVVHITKKRDGGHMISLDGHRAVTPHAAMLKFEKWYESQREQNPIKRLVQRRRATKAAPEGYYANPIDAGSFTMTVNGKSKTRFFFHTADAWARSHGLPYQLESAVTQKGAFVKFGKTRAYVCVDEGADGKPILETWEIRSLSFYNKREQNPIKTKPATLKERAATFRKELAGKDLQKLRAVFTKAVGYYPSKYSPDYELVALFGTHKEAVSAATLYASQHPKFRWFVKSL